MAPNGMLTAAVDISPVRMGPAPAVEEPRASGDSIAIAADPERPAIFETRHDSGLAAGEADDDTDEFEDEDEDEDDDEDEDEEDGEEGDWGEDDEDEDGDEDDDENEEYEDEDDEDEDDEDEPMQASIR